MVAITHSSSVCAPSAASRAMLFLAGVVCATVAALGASGVEAPERTGERLPLVIQIRLENEAITPVMARFIEREIQQAEADRAACVVILLDTPGGLVDSTRSVVKRILQSEVPIVVYVAPSGSRAASAGMFITLSAHVAAMAPGTNIGAAHPVQLGELPGSPSPPPDGRDRPSTTQAAPPPLEQKMVNDTVAWARALAELRGRNADWAGRAVSESLSASASEALREHAVDLLADDLNELLAKIDGSEVELASGRIRLSTRGATVRSVEMWWGERILAALSNPNVAFLLLILGFYAILFELYSPGWGVAGTVGVVCLLMGLLGMSVLPINYTGVALIAVALALFVAEAFITSYGALALGGAVCLVLGGLMLVDSPVGFQRVSLSLLIPIAVATAAITAFLVASILRTHRKHVHTGSEGLVGTFAVAEENFVWDGETYVGMTRAHGELWKAASPKPVAAHDPLEIDGRDGLRLIVRRTPEQNASETTEHLQAGHSAGSQSHAAHI